MTEAFLWKRAQGEKPKLLFELDAKGDYDADEVAYEDEWIKKGGNPYAGKYMPTGGTEILTVGIERLHNNPALFMLTDPEYFDFVVSTLRYPTL